MSVDQKLAGKERGTTFPFFPLRIIFQACAVRGTRLSPRTEKKETCFLETGFYTNYTRISFFCGFFFGERRPGTTAPADLGAV